MVSDSIVNAAIPSASKDLGKKKRANRSAKLKQCKLDARREQWLAQVRNKAGKEEVNGLGRGDINHPATELGNKGTRGLKDLELRQRREDNFGLVHPDSDSEMHTNSPTSCASAGDDMGNNFHGSNSSSSSRSSISCSSFSSVGCYSGSMTEEEEESGGGDDGCLDDWEAMADAMAAAAPPQDKPSHNQRTSATGKEEAVVQSASSEELGNTSKGILGAAGEKPQIEFLAIGTKPAANNNAWRPDDAFRPQSLPNLSKQNSFPIKLEKHCGSEMNPWGCNPMLPVPTCCPICCEDLDFTDSSFLPCPCGFRLCLFCHKRILEEDGRCPGCRKPYQLETSEKETNVCSASLTIRLARSHSMFTRV